jgi:hypothetical protein
LNQSPHVWWVIRAWQTTGELWNNQEEAHWTWLAMVKISPTMTKYLWQSTRKEERIIWAHTFGVSVHGQLAPLLLGQWQGYTSWWDHMGGQSCMPSGNKGKEKKSKALMNARQALYH